MNALSVLHRVTKNVPNLIRREPSFFLSEILLTYHCTQRCRQCSFPQKAGGMPAMDFEDFKTIVDRLDEFGTHGIILSGGEAFLHPRLHECLDYVMGKNFTYVHLLSNLYYSQIKLEKLFEPIFHYGIAFSCSFDGFDEVADDIRGANDVSRIVMENMEYLDRENNKRGRPIKTGVNIVVSQLNLHQIPAILTYLEKLHWPVSVDVYSSSQRREGEDLRITDLETLGKVLECAKKSPTVITPRWILDGFMDSFRGTAPKYCPYLLSPSIGSRFFVQPNGDVRVCKGNSIGNLIAQTPQEILLSKVWQEKHKEFEECAGCWNSCYTVFSKFSRYGVGELRRSIRLAKYWHDVPPAQITSSQADAVCRE